MSSPANDTVYFTWLHITDFHWDEAQKLLWEGKFREEFLKDLENLHEKSRPWDLILLTGDFAQHGEHEEFKIIFCSVIKEIQEKINELGSYPKLLVVPGEHDLKREVKVAIELDKSSKEEKLRKAVFDEKSPAYMKEIKEAIENYEKILEDYEKSPDYPRSNSHQNEKYCAEMPGDFSATITKGAFKLGIIGLNTAFSQLIDNHGGKCVLYRERFHQVCHGSLSRWAEKHDVCLLMTHHPLECFEKSLQDELQEELIAAGHISVHLYGHLHKTRIEIKKKIGYISGRSFFGEKREDESSDSDYDAGYVIGRIKLIDGYQRGELTFWPRCIGVEKNRKNGRRYFKKSFFSDNRAVGKDLNFQTEPEEIELYKSPKIMPERKIPFDKKGRKLGRPKLGSGRDNKINKIKEKLVRVSKNRKVIGRIFKVCLPPFFKGIG